MYVYTYICTHTAFIYTLCNYDFITPSLNCSHFFFHQIILHIFNRFFFLCYRYLRLYFAIVANVTSCWDSRYVHFKWDFATCHTKCCKWKRTNVAIRQSRSAHRNTYNETHTHTLTHTYTLTHTATANVRMETELLMVWGCATRNNGCRVCGKKRFNF